MGVGVAVGRRLLSVRQQLRQRCLSQSTKAAEEDRDLPGRVKLGTSPDKPRAQPCRPVWARVELCSRSQEDSHRKAGRKKKKKSRQDVAANLLTTGYRISRIGQDCVDSEQVDMTPALEGPAIQ